MSEGKEKKGRVLLQITEVDARRCSISMSLRSQEDCDKVAGTLLGAAYGPNGELLFDALYAIAATMLGEDQDELHDLAQKALTYGMMFAPNKVKS